MTPLLKTRTKYQSHLMPGMLILLCVSYLCRTDSEVKTLASDTSCGRWRNKRSHHHSHRRHRHRRRYNRRYDVLPMEYFDRSEDCKEAKLDHMDRIDHFCDSREYLVLNTTLWQRSTALELNMFPCKYCHYNIFIV